MKAWACCVLCGIILQFIYPLAAVADTPLPPPAIAEFQSADKQFVAVSDPDLDTNIVFHINPDGSRTRLWAMMGWFRGLMVCNDGEHLVIPYGGGNLLSLNHKKDERMLRFVHKGELINVATLGQIVRNEGSLPRTVSHRVWVTRLEFDEVGNLVMQNAEGLRTFDPKTGKQISEIPSIFRR